MPEAEHSDAVTADLAAVDGWRLVATGFNGHHQINARDGNISEFSTIIDGQGAADSRVLFAGWSNTVIVTSGSLIAIGLQQIEHRVEGVDSSAHHLRCGFGDHNGMRGCLDNIGRLYLVEPSSGQPEARKFERRGIATDYRLTGRSTEDSPLISHLAMAQNGRVALSFQQALSSHVCHLIEFGSLEAFQRWFEDPSSESNNAESHHMLPGRPKQLCAGTACFILLMASGEVYSWGDARYESLARSVSGDEAIPAARPGLIDALGGLKIVSISTGGWMSAALSEDGALYVWGAMTPASDGIIECLHGAEAGNVSLVEIPGAGSEPLEISGVAVGDDHILIIAGDENYVFAVGDNRNGQLGLGIGQGFLPQWQQVPSIWGACTVACGPRTSWAIVKDGR